jgi:hypothetical protein
LLGDKAYLRAATVRLVNPSVVEAVLVELVVVSVGGEVGGVELAVMMTVSLAGGRAVLLFCI